MNGCFDCSDAVNGLGQYEGIGTGAISTITSNIGSGGFWSGVGNFFSSGFGADLVKAGLTFGVGYGVHALTSGGGGGQPQQQPGNLVGGTTVNPAASGFIPQARGVDQQPIAAQSIATPSWVLPVSIIGGMAVLLFALKK